MNAQPKKRYYTVEEANHALPLVRAIVADIVCKHKEVFDRQERLEQVARTHGGKGRDRDDFYGEEVAHALAEQQNDIAALNQYVQELEELGVELKDPARGLVDFRSIMEGREVYLCWLLGEDEVAYWHELDAGFAGRQSLMAGSAADPTAGDAGGPTAN
jgi:hypothetical protein